MSLTNHFLKAQNIIKMVLLHVKLIKLEEFNLEITILVLISSLLLAEKYLVHMFGNMVLKKRSTELI